ncbi:MAG: alpha/beta hydrolase [Candidatus Riflebacteria bacterium]|nr:alpha/beta hydrolase [Candidatus Riflebacteria bacterium]
MKKYAMIFTACFVIVALLMFFQLVSMIITPPAFNPSDLKIPDGAVSFKTENDIGQTIPAWYYKGENDRGTIVLCHGHGVDHRNYHNVIPIFQKMKIGIILCDFRAHGSAGGKYTSIGMEEWKDLKAVIEKAYQIGYLQQNQQLAAYGRSMGAAILANGSAHIPQITAFILESCFAELRIIAARDGKRLMNLPDTFLTDIVFYSARLLSGYEYFNNKPIESVKGIASRPLLLIHDQLDPRATTEDFERFKKIMPNAATLVVPDAGHVCAFEKAPEKFEEEVRKILKAGKLNPF